jgi:hypothetical protein
MNIHIQKRIQGIHQVLSSAFEAGALLSSASKGYERETFISLFLNEVLPPIYRFGTGDITDAMANNDTSRKSGQIDIVIEMPWAPSFPIPAGGGVRLYPAEAVGAAIEVKSNIEDQWKEVVQESEKLAVLRQRLSGISVDDDGLEIPGSTDEPIPFYAVGYEGWKTAETTSRHLQGVELDGILIIKHQIFAWSDRKAYLSRKLRCDTELHKQRRGESFYMEQASCARLLEIREETPDLAYAADKMNSENYTTRHVHFGDQRYLPAVEVGKWTAENVREVSEILSIKVEAVQGNSALLQFVAFIHHEVAKRAAMTADISRYVV